MNPGLAQGFVKFDSLACLILRMYFQFGDMTHTDLVELIDSDSRHVSTVVGRLRKHHFIFKQDRACKYDTGTDKTEWIFGLKDGNRKYEVRIRTPAERQARLREKKRGHRASSVFNLGKTHVNLLQSRL